MRLTAFSCRATTEPGHPALEIGGRTVSASFLLRRAAWIAEGLSQTDVRAADRVVAVDLGEADALAAGLAAAVRGIAITATSTARAPSVIRTVCPRATLGGRPFEPIPNVNLLPVPREFAKDFAVDEVALARQTALAAAFLRWGAKPRGRYLAALPVNCELGLPVALAALGAGHVVVVPSTRDVSGIAAALLDGVTTTYLTPSLAAALADSRSPAPDLDSVFLGPRRSPPSLLRRLRDWLGDVVHELATDPNGLHFVPPTTSPSAGFWQRSRVRRARPALTDAATNETRTRAQLLTASRRVANALQAQLPRNGLVVSTVACPIAFVELYLGAMEAGMSFVPLSPNLPPHRARSLVVALGADLVVGEAMPELREPTTSYDDLVAGSPATKPRNRMAGQLLPLTSGSTGHPKIIRRHHPRCSPEWTAASEAVTGRLLGLSEDGVHLATVPLWSAAPLGIASAALHLGQQLIVQASWNPLTALELIERYGVTSAFFVPVMFASLLSARAHYARDFQLGSLETVIHGMGPCERGIKKQMLSWWGDIMVEYYATAEAAGTYVSSEEWRNRPGTVGRPFPGVRVTVLDDAGHTCPPMAPGRVHLSTSTLVDPSDDRAVGQASVCVGDIGFLDEEGWLFLVGRSADVINNRGSRVQAADVEAALMTLDEIRDVAVFGVDESGFGESIAALVVLTEGTMWEAPVRRHIRVRVRSLLPASHIPRWIEAVPELPRDELGKLHRGDLRAIYDGVIARREAASD